MLDENVASSSNSENGIILTPNNCEKDIRKAENNDKEKCNDLPEKKILKEKSVLIVDVKEARLTKNHGFLPMNLYCRLSVGGSIYETPTSLISGKHPIWNKRFNCLLPEKRHSISVQIMCENMVFADSEVASIEIELDPAIFEGFLVDRAYEFNSKGTEGTISICFQHRILQLNPQNNQVFESPIYGSVPCRKTITSDDIQVIHEIFPSIDEETILSVLQANAGDREKTVGVLFSMSNEK